jgi:MFS family permease
MTEVVQIKGLSQQVGRADESSSSLKRTILAAAVGTLFEWYDFMLYGTLAAILADKFFSGVDPTKAFAFSLLTFASGFIMRPVGAVVFGRIGDRIGRKQTFMITILIMGLGTVTIGLLPTYESIGITAPILLIALRMLQGLALGGEFGGAITYVVEHSPRSSRGFNTSWISVTGTLGILMSFVVIAVTRSAMGEAFNVWGWRLPFIISIVLLFISVRIRSRMHESPIFEQLRRENSLSKAPLSEVLLRWKNLRSVLISFALTAGMACIYYIIVLYPTYFLVRILKIDAQVVNLLSMLAVASCVPVVIGAGWLSDRIGRKPVLIGAYIVAAVALFPTFYAFSFFGNPALARAEKYAPVVLQASSADCSLMFSSPNSAADALPCDWTRNILSDLGISYSRQENVTASSVIVRIGDKDTVKLDLPPELTGAESEKRKTGFGIALRAKLAEAGYPARAENAQVSSAGIFAAMLVLLTCMALSVGTVPLVMVEMFSTRIRYTGMSIPYHAAQGWVGGLLPVIVFAGSAQVGNIYAGLAYPLMWIIGAGLVCIFFYRETKERDLQDL